MKTLIKVFLLLAFVHGFVILLSNHTTAELIEPTRTLGTDSDKVGYLSVFSEPPEQEVWLDKEMIGLTPIVQHRVDAGVYVLKISDKETEIKFKPDQSIRLGIFRGELIVIPEKKPVSPVRAKSAAEDRLDPVKKEDPGKPLRLRDDYFYWPQNPTGPIY